ncbi:Choline dehydrogenase [Rothia kristinae]|nr:Choline dehydrogenase [Rothia kristinae]
MAEEQVFDYIIVGGGSSGAAAAARLSEKNPRAQVALIEAGPDDAGIDEVLQLNRWMELLESGYDWDYPVEEQEHGNSFMRMARAKVMGGCSSHNSCIAFWAPAEDWMTGSAASGHRLERGDGFPPVPPAGDQ